jgi:hypothetical protein
MTTASSPEPPACGPHSGCVTCADEGVPMRVLRVPSDYLAECADPDGGVVEVLTGVVDRVAPGDTLLVHAGTALLRLASGIDRP